MVCRCGHRGYTWARLHSLSCLVLWIGLLGLSTLELGLALGFMVGWRQNFLTWSECIFKSGSWHVATPNIPYLFTWPYWVACIKLLNHLDRDFEHIKTTNLLAIFKTYVFTVYQYQQPKMHHPYIIQQRIEEFRIFFSKRAYGIQCLHIIRNKISAKQHLNRPYCNSKWNIIVIHNEPTTKYTTELLSRLAGRLGVGITT